MNISEVQYNNHCMNSDSHCLESLPEGGKYDHILPTSSLREGNMAHTHPPLLWD